MRHQLGKKGNAGFIERAAITAKALGIGLVSELISEVGDAAMTKTDQMIRGLAARLYVFDHDGIDEVPGVLIVDQHNRDFHLGKKRHVERSDSRRGYGDTVHSPFRK